ncbi:hypothetical protein [Marispirochaeta aestuarii]|uniref:hypothetical protein n=1 Tax=Marispirochaeta aestuarii TaxID=1963862 RepID=UPI0029C6C672|nr:hypothetical protein [Marispirochaeta aestuarii]
MYKERHAALFFFFFAGDRTSASLPYSGSFGPRERLRHSLGQVQVLVSSWMYKERHAALFFFFLPETGLEPVRAY